MNDLYLKMEELFFYKKRLNGYAFSLLLGGAKWGEPNGDVHFLILFC